MNIEIRVSQRADKTYEWFIRESKTTLLALLWGRQMYDFGIESSFEAATHSAKISLQNLIRNNYV